MVFTVPESKRSIAQNRFHFELPNGDAVSIPKAKYLTTGQIESLSSLGRSASIVDLLSVFDEPEAAAAVRTLDMEQLEALMSAWQSDSDVELGESSAS